jgi:hypothetical protein
LAEEMRTGSRQWKPFVPDFRVVLASANDKTGFPIGMSEEQTAVYRLAMAELRQELPTEHASAVERFPEGQWAMMVLMHRYPEALDLARTSPALMYCLANSDQFRGTVPEVAAIQALFRSRQRQRALPRNP